MFSYKTLVSVEIRTRGSLKQKFGRMGLVQFQKNIVSEVMFPNFKLGKQREE